MAEQAPGRGPLFPVGTSLGMPPDWPEDREARRQRPGRSRWVAMCAALGTTLRAQRPLRLHVEPHAELAMAAGLVPQWCARLVKLWPRCRDGNRRLDTHPSASGPRGASLPTQ